MRGGGDAGGGSGGGAVRWRREEEEGEKASGNTLRCTTGKYKKSLGFFSFFLYFDSKGSFIIS